MDFRKLKWIAGGALVLLIALSFFGSPPLPQAAIDRFAENRAHLLFPSAPGPRLERRDPIDLWFSRMEAAADLSSEELESLSQDFRALARARPQAVQEAAAHRFNSAHEGPLEPPFLLAGLVVDWGAPGTPVLNHLLSLKIASAEDMHARGPSVRLNRVKAYALRQLVHRGSAPVPDLQQSLFRLAAEDQDLDVASQAARALASSGPVGRARSERAKALRPASHHFAFER